MNLVSMFDESVARSPGKSLLVYGERSFSYEDIQALSFRAAAVLDDQGVGHGDRVALMCFNTPYFLVALLGALRLGAVIVPVNHKLQPPEVDFILRHCAAGVLIVDGQLAPIVQDLDIRSLTILTTDSRAPQYPLFDEQVAATSPRPCGAPRGAEELAEIVYTSGTTGRAKGCMHTHRGVFMTALCTATGLSISRLDRLLMSMPMWHASPLNNWLFAILLVGGSIVLLREHSPRGMLEAIQAEQVTLVFGAPIALVAPVQSMPDFECFDKRSVRLWICGGGPASAPLIHRLMDAYGTDDIVQVYGMTETGPLGTALYPEDARRKAGSIGRTGLPGARVRVMTEGGRPVRPGEVGEIMLDTEGRMSGYLNDPAASAEAFDADGWYRSGDLATVDDDGFLFIVDRRKDVIVTGGENVYSKEVEDVLAEHPAIVEIAVVGRQHPEWGETLVAAIVWRSGHEASADELRHFLASRLARYKIPREFVAVETLPRTPSGKVQKHLLRSLI